MKLFVNLLTLIRLLATFILPFMWGILSPINIIVFVSLVLLTDFFDGFLARKFHVQTLFGSVLDTVADKVFGIIIVLVLALYYPIYYIIAVLETLIALINVFAALKGIRTKSSFIGRSKMWILGVSTVIGMIFIFQEYLLNIKFIKQVLEMIINNEINLLISFVFLTAGAEIMVLIDYVIKVGKELKSKKDKIEYNFKSNKDLKYVLFNTDYYLTNKNMPISKHLLK